MRIRRHALIIAVASALSASTVSADVSWNNIAGGAWQTGSNWAGGFFPEGNQVARFGLNRTTPYTVTFNVNTSVGGVTVNSDHVNFDLSGRSLNLTNAGTSLLVGDASSKVTSVLTVSGGSMFATGNAVVGNTAASNGTLNLTGLGTTLGLTEFDIGMSGTGLLSISQQAVVNAATVKTSLLAGSTGTINVGTGSQLHIAGLLQIGERGTGALNITGGGQVDATYMLTAINPDHTSGQVQANITVDGAGSSLALANQLVLGVAAPANLAVTNGATVSTGGSGGFQIGGSNLGSGALTVATGASVNSTGGISLGTAAGSTGVASLADSGSMINVTGKQFNIGESGTGSFTQSDGLLLVQNDISIATNTGSTGTYALRGGLASAASLYIGGSGDGIGGAGKLAMSGGALVLSNNLQVFNQASSTLDLTGGLISTPSMQIWGNASQYTTYTGAAGDPPVAVTANVAVSGAIEISHGGNYDISAGNLTAGGLFLGGDSGGANGTGALSISATTITTSTVAAGFANISGPVTIFPGGILNVKSGGQIHFGGPIFNSGLISLTGGAMDFNGSSLTGTGTIAYGGGTILNNAPTPSTIGSPVTLSGNPTFNTGFGRGDMTFTGIISGSGSLAKFDVGTMTITSQTSYTGSTRVAGGTAVVFNSDGGGSSTAGTGTLNLVGKFGSILTTSAVAIDYGGTLLLDNRNSSGGAPAMANGRVKDTAPITFGPGGGTIRFYGTDSTASSETLGSLSQQPEFDIAAPNAGGSTINLINGASGTATLNFAGNLANRATGFTLNIAANNLGSDNKVLFAGQSAGFIAGWATIDNGPKDNATFAKYVPATGAVMMTNEDWSSGFSSGQHVRLTGPLNTTVGSMSIQTLTLDNRLGTVNINQAGSLLTFSQGGLLSLGKFTGIIRGGSITTSRGDHELDTYVQFGNTLVLGSAIVNNESAVSFAKTGPGQLLLGTGSGDTMPNTFTGNLYLNDGTLVLNKAANTIAVNSTIAISGGTLMIPRPGQLGAATHVQLLHGTVIANGGGSASMSALTNSGGTMLIGDQFSVGSVTLTGGITTFLTGGGLAVTPFNANQYLPTTIGGGQNEWQAGTYLATGQVMFNGSTPSLQIDSGNSSDAPGDPTLNGPALFTLDGNITLTSSAAAAITTTAVTPGQSPGLLDLAGNVRTFTTLPGSSLSISTGIQNGGITVAGSGSVMLKGANTYSGGTNLNGGLLIATDPAALGIVDSPVTFAGGSLSLRSDAGTMTLMQPLKAGPSVSMNIDLSALTDGDVSQTKFAFGNVLAGVSINTTGTQNKSLIVGGVTLQNISSSATGFRNATDMTVNGPITMAVSATNGDVLKNSLGTLTFAGTTANTYTGLTTVAQGALVLNKPANVLAVPHDLSINGLGSVLLDANGQISPTAKVTLNAATGNAKLDLNGFNNTIGSLAFLAGGTVATGNGIATLAGDVSFTGISGTANITGKLDLGGASRNFDLQRGSATADLQIGAVISGAAGSALSKSGRNGVLLLSGANTYAGATTIGMGTLRIASTGKLPATTDVAVANGSILAFDAVTGLVPTIVKSLSLANSSTVLQSTGSPANRRVLELNLLSIDPASNLNLNANDLIVHGGDINAVTALIKTGFNSGAGYWNGNGIRSTSAANDGAFLTALGSVKRTSAGVFDNESVAIGDVTVKFTYYGDADLSGGINGNDYTLIDNGFNLHSTGWQNGDFNYDGFVDGSDYSLIDNAFNRQSTSLAAIPASMVATPAGVTESVPEPGGLLAVLGFGLALRRRRFINCGSANTTLHH